MFCEGNFLKKSTLLVTCFYDFSPGNNAEPLIRYDFLKKSLISMKNQKVVNKNQNIKGIKSQNI